MARSIGAAQGKVIGAQEGDVADEGGDYGQHIQTLRGLGEANFLVNAVLPNGDYATPTGGFAHDKHLPLGITVPGSLDTARAFPSIQGFAGIPSREQTTNLGTLDKLTALTAPGTIIGKITDSARENAGHATFNIGYDAGTNKKNTEYLLQQVVGSALENRAKQYWLNYYGDLNAPATDGAGHSIGMTFPTYVSMLRNQIPMTGRDFEDPSKYNISVKTPDGGTFKIPELQQDVNVIARTIGSGYKSNPSASHWPSDKASKPVASGVTHVWTPQGGIRPVR